MTGDEIVIDKKNADNNDDEGSLGWNLGRVWGAVTILALIFALAWFVAYELIK